MNYKKIHLGKLIQSFVKKNHINSANPSNEKKSDIDTIFDTLKLLVEEKLKEND